MKQYNAIKRKHPDAILLFRVGDFYETFSKDAIKASEILGITLTRRANGAASYVELAGFPHHALDTYLPKLVRAGQRVAICEQLEDPKLTKTIVKRGITELVTPGVSFNDNVLERKENNFLACVHIEKKFAGVAFLDISTGEFYAAEGSFEYVDKLLTNFGPKEVLVERSKYREFTEFFGTKFYIYKFDEWAYNEEGAREKLLTHFQTSSLKGFGIDSIRLGVIAAGAALYYLDLTQHHQVNHITSISRLDEDRYVWLDKFTIRNLELFYSANEGAKTLIDIVDKTLSPMGGRLLKKWVALPLKDTKPISERLNVVDFFISNDETFESLRESIREIGDVERVISKAAVGRISPREMVSLKNALSLLVPIKKQCEESNEPTLQRIGEQVNLCARIRDRIEKEIVPDPPALLSKGNVVAEGVNSELDELRSIMRSGKDYLVNLQQRESERTGIPSLKVSFNNVFGYYIEVRNTHKDKVPPEWIRKQTLVSAERYITEELKEYESKILGAEEKVMSIEQQLFEQLVFSLSEYIASIQLNANLVAQIDCLLSFAACAKDYGYCKPEVNESLAINIKEGRHPVIERMLPAGEEYVSNDVFLDTTNQQVVIITGPNMSGKSALLRQTALIVLLSQIGSFVPAKAAKIGVVDKIFTRVGASDNISLGESTFMVEMLEAASILNNISERSLVLLDEIGRGTSTYDGISIAWAMTEYIHENPNGKAKTLFATHYHELNEMEGAFSRIKNFNVSIKEMDNKVIFLRKLIPGGSAHSFGIHVARMAGMPPSVVKRANEILKELERNPQNQKLAKPSSEMGRQREGYQLSFFQLDDPVLKQIRDQLAKLDVNNLTPIEALNKLNEIKRMTGL
ncbi:MAG TPA: DNA mismatch repair protein MutS [Tenuifilaceae bacterium]|nr:DNA mismatch repair protein MutS [Tenuifilaceae bacterium]HPQ35081.1 DNA mismatch repair protein MutS [Tenuifilaceae bacterium]